MLHGSRRAIAVVGERVGHDRHAGRSVTLIPDLFQRIAFQRAGASLDGAVDLVGRHVYLACLLDRQPEPEVAVGVASTLFGRDCDFTGGTCERLTTLGVDHCFFVFDAGPFRVA